jgi:hypothetical protein
MHIRALTSKIIGKEPNGIDDEGLGVDQERVAASKIKQVRKAERRLRERPK